MMGTEEEGKKEGKRETQKMEKHALLYSCYENIQVTTNFFQIDLR